MKINHGDEVEYHFEEDELLHGIAVLRGMLETCREMPEQEGRDETARALETGAEAMEALLGKIWEGDDGRQT